MQFTIVTWLFKVFINTFTHPKKWVQVREVLYCRLARCTEGKAYISLHVQITKVTSNCTSRGQPVQVCGVGVLVSIDQITIHAFANIQKDIIKGFENIH